MWKFLRSSSVSHTLELQDFVKEHGYLLHCKDLHSSFIYKLLAFAHAEPFARNFSLHVPDYKVGHKDKKRWLE